MSQACTWIFNEPICACCPTLMVSTVCCAFTLSSTCNVAPACGTQVSCIACGGGRGPAGGVRPGGTAGGWLCVWLVGGCAGVWSDGCGAACGVICGGAYCADGGSSGVAVIGGGAGTGCASAATGSAIAASKPTGPLLPRGT